MARGKAAGEVTKPKQTAKADKAKKPEVEAANDDDAVAAGEQHDEAEDELVRKRLLAHAFAADNIVGQLADRLIEYARTERKPWSKLKEAQQEQIIMDATRFARVLIADMLDATASKGLPHMEVTLEGGSFKMGDGALKLKAVVDFTQDNLDALSGGSIKGVLVLASMREFNGPPTITAQPDQPALIDEPAKPEDTPHDPDTGEVLDDEGGDEDTVNEDEREDIDEETERNARRRAP